MHTQRRRTTQDITGKRFGRLVAVEFMYYDNKYRDCWLFTCDCGNKKVMPAAHVKWGRVRSCGCLAKERITSLNKQNIAGEKYGRLTAIRPTKRRDVSGSIIWECICECGNKALYSVNRLKQGRTKSCGCLYTESRGKTADKRKDAIEGTLLSSLVASKKPRADNSSGYTGVCYDKRSGKWVAYIGFQKKRIYLGIFKEKEEAIRKRKEAEDKLHDPIIQEYWINLTKRGREQWKAYAIEKTAE